MEMEKRLREREVKIFELQPMKHFEADRGGVGKVLDISASTIRPISGRSGLEIEKWAAGGADLPTLNSRREFRQPFQPQADAGAFNQIGQVQAFDPLSSSSATKSPGKAGRTRACFSISWTAVRCAAARGPEASIPAGASQLFQEAFGSDAAGGGGRTSWIR